jgi:hypothetical protein
VTASRFPPFSFISPAHLSVAAQSGQRGKDPELNWFAPGPCLGVLLREANVGARGIAWARAVSSSFALAAKARDAGEVGGRNLPGANPWFRGGE